MSVPVRVSDTQITKALLESLQSTMVAHPDRIELPVKHHHVRAVKHSPSGGVYARELFIPAGTVVVGHIHKYEQLNIVSQGHVVMATEEGIFEFEAPYTVVSPSGVKRAVYALTDTVWTTIHGTDEQDIEEIEKMFVVDTFDKYLEFTKE